MTVRDIFSYIVSHHHCTVTHVELGNAGHQSVFMLLHNCRYPAQSVLVLLRKNTANTINSWVLSAEHFQVNDYHFS